MFYDPDAPKVPGEPDYSKGCIQDLPEDMQPQFPVAEAEAPTQPTSSQPSAAAAAPSLSEPAESVFSVPSTPPPPSLMSHAAGLLPGGAGGGAGGPSWLTTVSPVMSVLYLALLLAVLASFYFLPIRPRGRQKEGGKAQSAVRRVLAAAMAASTSSSAPSSLYTTHASTVPPHVSAHFTPLELSHAVRAIATAFDEDVLTGDISTLSTIPADSQSVAVFLAKEAGTVSGTHVVDLAFHLFDPAIRTAWLVQAGTAVSAGTKLGTVSGPSRSLLTAERVALNFVQRMSGIATATQRLVAAIAAAGSRSVLLDTRKTVPGLRMLDKMAVRDGGGKNHRIGLYDMVMIKDNHITAAGGIPNAINAVRWWCAEHGRKVPLEVETRTLVEVQQLLDFLHLPDSETAGGDAAVPVTRVMLDNMVRVSRSADGRVVDVDVSTLTKAVQMLQADDKGRLLESEASGNVMLDTIGHIARSGVTFISVGAVTHSVAALDVSLKIQPKP